MKLTALSLVGLLVATEACTSVKRFPPMRDVPKISQDVLVQRDSELWLTNAKDVCESCNVYALWAREVHEACDDIPYEAIDAVRENKSCNPKAPYPGFTVRMPEDVYDCEKVMLCAERFQDLQNSWEDYKRCGSFPTHWGHLSEYENRGCNSVKNL